MPKMIYENVEFKSKEKPHTAMPSVCKSLENFVRMDSSIVTYYDFF